MISPDNFHSVRAERKPLLDELQLRLIWVLLDLDAATFTPVSSLLETRAPSEHEKDPPVWRDHRFDCERQGFFNPRVGVDQVEEPRAARGYAARPPLALDRLEELPDHRLAYRLKTPVARRDDPRADGSP